MAVARAIKEEKRRGFDLALYHLHPFRLFQVRRIDRKEGRAIISLSFLLLREINRAAFFPVYPANLK